MCAVLRNFKYERGEIFVHIIHGVPVENPVDNVPKRCKTVENPVDNVQNRRAALWKIGGNGVELLTEMYVKREF